MPLATSAPQAHFLAQLLKQVLFPGGPGVAAGVMGVETAGRGSYMKQEPAGEILPGLCQGRCPPGWADLGSPGEGEGPYRQVLCPRTPTWSGTSSSSISCAGALVATLFPRGS